MKSNEIKLNTYKVIFTLNRHVIYYMHDAKCCFGHMRPYSSSTLDEFKCIYMGGGGGGMTRWERNGTAADHGSKPGH